MNGTIDETLFINIRYIVEFVSYFIFAFTSSLLKEVYCANTHPKYIFGPYRVISSTVIATLATVALKEIYSNELNGLWGITALISTIFGLLGFEIFKHLTSISGIKSLISEIKDLKNEILTDEDIPKKKIDNTRRYIRKKSNDDE